MTLNYTFEQLFSAFKDSFNLALTKFKEQKVVRRLIEAAKVQ
jgi:hypothetical protein